MLSLHGKRNGTKLVKLPAFPKGLCGKFFVTMIVTNIYKSSTLQLRLRWSREAALQKVRRLPV